MVRDSMGFCGMVPGYRGAVSQGMGHIEKFMYKKNFLL